MNSGPRGLRGNSLLSDLLGRSRLGIQMLERTRFDTVSIDERIDLVLLQSDHPAEPIGGKLAFIDQPVQSSWRKPERGSRFLGGEPVTVSLRHVVEHYNISSPLTQSPANASAVSSAHREKRENSCSTKIR